MVAFSLNQDLTREDQMENPPDPLLSNDDLFEGPIVPGQLPEELNDQLTIVASLESRITDMCYLVSDMKRSGGMSKSFALEAARIVPGSTRPIGFYSEHPSATQYKVSLESFTDKIVQAWKRLMNVLQVIFAKAMSLAKEAMKSPEAKQTDEMKKFLGLAKTKAKEAAGMAEKVKEATGNETAIDRDSARFGHMFKEMADAYAKVDPEVAAEYRAAYDIFSHGAGPGKPATESYDAEAEYTPAQFHVRNSIEWAQNKLPNILRRGNFHECQQARAVANEAATRIAETHLNFRKGGQLRQGQYDNYQNHITQFRDELVRNFADQDEPLAANSVLSEVLDNFNSGTVVTEGFMDFVRDLFAGDKPDFDRKSGSSDGHKKVLDYMRKFFLDPSWVARNLKQGSVSLGERDYSELMYDGKVLPIEQALTVSAKRSTDAFSKYGTAIKAFSAGVKKTLVAANAEFKRSGPDEAKVGAILEEGMRTIKYPKEAEQVETEYVTQMQKNMAVAKKGPRDIPAPASVEAFIALTKTVLANVENAMALDAKSNDYYVAGTDFADYDFWDDHEDAGDWTDKWRTNEIGDFYYDQGLPEMVSDLVTWPAWKYTKTVQASIAYLVASTKMDSKAYASEELFIATEAVKINIGIRMITKIVELIKFLYEKISKWISEKFGSNKNPTEADVNTAATMAERMAKQSEDLAQAAAQTVQSESESNASIQEALDALRKTNETIKKVNPADIKSAAKPTGPAPKAEGSASDRLKDAEQRIKDAMEKVKKGGNGKIEPMSF